MSEAPERCSTRSGSGHEVGRGADLHRPAPRPRGHLPAGLRRPPAGRPLGPPPRPDAGDRRPQRPHRRHPCRPDDPRRALPEAGRDARAQLRGVRRAALLAGLGPARDRPRDRPRAGHHPAGDDDRLRRLTHLDPRRLRRARVRHRHLRGRARPGDPDAWARGGRRRCGSTTRASCRAGSAPRT